MLRVVIPPSSPPFYIIIFRTSRLVIHFFMCHYMVTLPFHSNPTCMGEKYFSKSLDNASRMCYHGRLCYQVFKIHIHEHLTSVIRFDKLITYD